MMPSKRHDNQAARISFGRTHQVATTILYLPIGIWEFVVMKTCSILASTFEKGFFRSLVNRAKRSTEFLARVASTLLLLAASCELSHAAVFTVTNTSGSESVVDSLPWALREAWTSPGNDTIRFSIDLPPMADGGIHITVTTAVPLAVGDADTTSGIVIDGTTQPGYYENFPIIWIDANGRDTAFNVIGRGSAIKGLGMYNFKIAGIALLDQGSSPGRHLVDDCWIGFHRMPFGHTYMKNTAYGHTLSIGISAEVPDNVITNNKISGLYNGIVVGKDPVADPSSSANYWISYNNYIANNRIGTGTHVGWGEDVGNTSDGIFLGNGATYNHIAYNVIGDNAGTGVKLLGSSGVVNYVYGNLIGVDSDGWDFGNGEFGVLVANRSNNN